MGIYNTVQFVLLFLNLFNKKNEVTRILFISVIVFLILFSGLRATGFDYEAYLLLYKDNIGPAMEPGFILLLTITQLFNNSVIFFLSIAILAVSLKASFIYKYSPYPFLSLLLYYNISFMIHDMGQIRYGLAMGIVLFALIGLAENNSKRFFLLSSMAVCFHFSAVCVFPLYIFRKAELTVKTVVFYIFVGVIIFKWFDIANLILSNLNMLPIESMEDRASLYSMGSSTDDRVENMGLNLSFFLRLFYLFLLYYTNKRENNPIMKSMLLFYFYGIVLYLMFGSIVEFAYRFSGYFRLLDVIIVPYIIYHLKNKLIQMTFVIFVLFYVNKGIILGDVDETIKEYYIPYKTVLN